MPDITSLPSGLVTFMFTDIVGSTNMKGKMPGATSGERQDAFRKNVKAPHDAIITGSVLAHGGCVVKSTGDGFFCAFNDAEKAVLCAVEIQREMGNAMIFTPSGILQIRIGLNSGQAEPINSDYTASAADKSARVESRCEPGKVYLSRETHELVRGKVRTVSTASAGSHDLKGVAKEDLFVAFTARSSSTQTEAPVKIFASSRIPNNLPRLQSFFGRTEELKQIAEALDPESRTWGALIDGPGGMGKTSLAVRAAYDCPRAQFERIIFVSVKDRELDDDGERALGNLLVPGFLEMLNEIARELGQSDFSKAPEDQRIRLLLEALRPAKALLILDNLESIPKSERDQLFTFVRRLPEGCKAILTSRRRIGSGSDLLILEKLDETAALETLGDLAQHNPLLAKTNEAERLTLWKQTGGNPLLLRWVAGQLGRGSCRTFTDALHFLRSCPRDNDPLEFIFGDLANEFTLEEERVLVALTYFTLLAKVEHIATVAGLSKEPIGTALDTLANRSLVVPDQEEKQYALVPMVAEFLRRHRSQIVQETGNRLERRAYALIVENGDQNHDRFPVLDAAWPTVAPALPIFLAGPNDQLQTVSRALTLFLEFTGRWDESLSLNKQAETRAEAEGDRYNAGWRAKEAGYVYRLRRQADAVLDCANRAAEHWEAGNGGVRERAIATRFRGIAYELKEEHAEAIRAYRESLDLLRSLSTESEDVALGLNDLAGSERLSGNFAAAEQDYREALRVARAVCDTEGVAIYTGNLVELEQDRKNWPKSEKLAREALRLSEELGRQELVASNCHRLAQAFVRQGKASEALPYARHSVEIYIKLGSPDLPSAQAALAECEEAMSRSSE
ncbi:MAG TPA: tetratricopeptide repeat protein [Pyrinomonadaceae bacterium]|jgi:class 3 adenylate cyclase/tetratricopeptide (TPR) repeat protein|nr:tetratricopeptide repeat protein [Pyrinomonadaceae bacterium]